MPSRGGPQTANESALLDIFDPPAYSTSLTGAPMYARGGASHYFPTGLTSPVLESTSGWASARKDGDFWALASSAVNTVKTRNTTRFLIPVTLDLVNAPASAYMPMRFRHEVVVFRTTPLAVAAPLSYSLGWFGGTQRELSDSTAAGYEIVSRSDLNAGRWTIRTRFTNGGALVVVVDTGIDPAATPYVHLMLDAQVSISPRLSCRVNGTEYGVLAGIAALPAGTSGNVQSIGLAQGLSVGGAAGQTDYSRQCRFRVSQLAGFLE